MLQRLIDDLKSEPIKQVFQGLYDELSSMRRQLGIAIALLAVLLLSTTACLLTNGANLESRVARLEERVKKAEQTSVAMARTQPTQPTAEPTARATPIATPTPLPARVYKTKITNYGATTKGVGSFTIRMEAVEGGNLSLEEAKGQIARDVRLISESCNSTHRDFAFYSLSEGGRVGKVVQSLDGRESVSQGCWSTLEKLTGKKPSNKLFQEAVSTLRGYAGVGKRTTLFVEEDGTILGFWDWGSPPKEKGCLEQGLKEIGMTKPYFTVDLWAPEVWKVLYDNAFTDWSQWGERVPDLCQSANLIPTSKPNWVKYSYEDDSHTIAVKGLEVQIHSDPSICRVYTSQWQRGQNLVEVNGKKVAVIGQDDLVLVMDGFGDLDRMIYVTVNGDTIHWYKPKGQGTDWTTFQYVAAVQTSPSVDGMLHVRIDPAGGNPSPYIIGDKVIHQNKAKKPPEG